MTTSAAEQRAQRRITAAFIAADHVTIALVPRVMSVTPAGAKSYVDGAPRDPQRFKLSELAYDQRPAITVAGVERIIDYHLICLPDAVVELNDKWQASDGTWFEVVGFSDGFEYERKAYVARHLPTNARP